MLTGGTFTGLPDATLFGAVGAATSDGAALLAADAVAFTGRDGVSLIGSDAASIIGLDVADLLAHDGTPLGGAGGGAIAGPDGANLVGADGVPLGDQAFSDEVPVASYRGSLIALNTGGVITGMVRSPFKPSGYRLQAVADQPAPGAGVWAMDGHGRPYATPAITDAKGAYRIETLRHTLSGVVLGVAVGPAKLLALAKAPGSGERSVLIDAASTAATSVVLAPLLRHSGLIRPIDHDRYLTLVRLLRGQLTQADAEAIAKGPLQATATLTLAFCAAKGIAVDVNGAVTTLAGTPPQAGPLDRPVELALDKAGKRLFVADRGSFGLQTLARPARRTSTCSTA